MFPRIHKAELIEVALPLITPYTTGFGTLFDRHTLLVRLETEDGVIGWGEAAQLQDPIYLEEWLNGSWHFIVEYLLPLVTGSGITAKQFAHEVKKYRRHNISKFAVETALWMIEAKRAGTSYATLVGGVRKTIESGASVGIQESREKTILSVRNKLDAGYKRIKLKIRPGWDYEIVKAIQNKFPDCQLMVDANSSYTLDDIEQLKKLDKFDLLMIEQPLAYDDIVDHAELAKHIKTPICLDESICSAADARKAIQLGACQIINVKPARVGSLYAVQEMNQLAHEKNIQLWCGGMLEGDIGKIANLAAASLSEFSLPADISNWKTYFSSTFTDIDKMYSPPTFTLSDTFGSDVSVDESWIKRYTVRKKRYVSNF